MRPDFISGPYRAPQSHSSGLPWLIAALGWIAFALALLLH
jgi:hypothetical protein